MSPLTLAETRATTTIQRSLFVAMLEVVVVRRGFGELEAAIMEYLWSQDGPRTVREMHTALSSARGSAYTTISTVVENLCRKGWLRREPASRRAFSYLPVASREEYGARLMREALDSSGDRAEALVRFVGGMSAREAAALRAALQAHEDTPR